MITRSDNPTAIDVMHVLIRTTQYLKKEYTSQISSLQSSIQITGPRLRLLSIVANAGQIRMKELADELGVTARTVTDFIDALEKDNLLIRFPDPTDRRATLIQLTELAQANINEALSIQTDITEKLFENLSPERRNQLLELLFLLIEEKDLSNPDESNLK